MARADFTGYEFGQGRLDKGVDLMAKAIDMFLTRNDLTHERLRNLVAWANPWGENWTSTSQISNLKTKKLQQPGPKTWQALGHVNLRLAWVAGDRSQRVTDFISKYTDFGPIPSKIGIPDEPFFLRQSITRIPMGAMEFGGLWMNDFQVEGLDDTSITEDDAIKLSENLSARIDHWSKRKDITFVKAAQLMLEAYGVDDESRRELLREVIFGTKTYTPSQLKAELPAMAGLLSVMEASDKPLSEIDVQNLLYRGPKP